MTTLVYRGVSYTPGKSTDKKRREERKFSYRANQYTSLA